MKRVNRFPQISTFFSICMGGGRFGQLLHKMLSDIYGIIGVVLVKQHYLTIRLCKVTRESHNGFSILFPLPPQGGGGLSPGACVGHLPVLTLSHTAQIGHHLD